MVAGPHRPLVAPNALGAYKYERKGEDQTGSAQWSFPHPAQFPTMFSKVAFVALSAFAAQAFAMSFIGKSSVDTRPGIF